MTWPIEEADSPVSLKRLWGGEAINKIVEIAVQLSATGWSLKVTSMAGR